jgi:hypothetical protein
MRRHTVKLYAWLLFLALRGPGLLQAETESSGIRPVLRELTPLEQARLAEQFAPVLVFHPSEQYFHASPLFPLKTQTGAAARLLLGTPKAREEAYRHLPLRDKAKLATVYYRAYPSWAAGEAVVVLEYWLYYVRNEYRVRSNILPFWFDGSHPNDLEHIHLVLRPDATDSLKLRLGQSAEKSEFSVSEAYASAHEGKIPANRYRYSDELQKGPTRFLVELGSHALAPDIDEDGLFTPGVDAESGSKILWGIRDKGMTWSGYSTSYMTARSNGNAIALSYKGNKETLEDVPDDRHFSYELVPASTLLERFARLNLSEEQRKYAFETQVFWFNRVFGKDNGRSDKLLMPAPAEIGGESIGVSDASSSERLFLVGTVLNMDNPGLFAGGRYSYLTSSRYLPDLMFQVDAIVTRKDQYLSPQLLLSYPIDGFTRIMAGQALTTDSLSFEHRQWGWVGTIEFRLGDMRISASTRKSGEVRHAAKEFRLFYAF